MKYSFTFLRVANWVYIIRTKLKQLRVRLDTEKVSKQETIKLLERQKASLLLIKDVINKKTRLIGIQQDFIKNLDAIKRELGVE